MDQQQILNATITIEEVINKEKKLSIKGHDGNRILTYSLFKTKQDGSDTSAYAQFKNMGLTSGSTVMIGYVIDEYETEINGFPKRVQSKKIINFREAVQGQEKPRTQTQSSNGGANRGQSGSGGVLKNDAFWEKQAYEKCCSLWATQLLGKDGSFASVKVLIDGGQFYELFQAIKTDGAKRFSSEAVRPTHLEELPVIQQDETDTDEIEDIPF